MKVLVTGSSGLIGAAVVNALAARGHEVTALYHSFKPSFVSPKIKVQAMDLSSPASLERLVLDTFPDAVINCAAWSSQDVVARDPDAAEKINVSLPRQLAMLSKHVGARFLHLSTDMVFDGSQEAPYRSTDKPNPLNLYGQMKLLAEREVLRYAAGVGVVLRITLVTGNSIRGDRSLHERLLLDLAEGKRKRWTLLTNEYRQPVSNANVAELLTELCERPSLTGIFHWTGVERLSRYEIGRLILARFGLGEEWLEGAEGNDPTRAPDLALEPAPLLGKVKTRPMGFEEQLEAMHLPESCRAWVAANQQPGLAENWREGGRSARIERFVEGQDF